MRRNPSCFPPDRTKIFDGRCVRTTHNKVVSLLSQKSMDDDTFASVAITRKRQRDDVRYKTR